MTLRQLKRSLDRPSATQFRLNETLREREQTPKELNQTNVQ